MNKELDWSKAQPNKFAGKPLAIVGDRQRRKLPPPAGKFLFRFTFVNGTQMEVPADTEKAAREWVLGYFGWARMPRGCQLERVANVINKQQAA